MRRFLVILHKYAENHLCPCGGMEDAVGLEPAEEIHMGSSPILDTPQGKGINTKYRK